MNIQSILDLNTDFYNKNFEEFSKTRQSAWPGWKYALEFVKSEYTNIPLLNTLDIGCGNGRFYQFLTEKYQKPFSYLGIDNNDKFLLQAILRYPNAQFKKIDIFNDLASIKEQFELVTIFGITHHIPGKSFRLDWFDNICQKIAQKGMLIITFWNLDSDPRFSKAVKARELEENDYYYSWNKTNTRRYVHLYNKTEVELIVEVFKRNKLKLIKSFDSDGKNGIMNSYLILKKT